MSFTFPKQKFCESQKVLVMGDLTTANIISKHLKLEGFNPILQSDLLRSFFQDRIESQDLSKIRTLLTEFSAVSGREGLIHPGTTVWAERPELSTIAQQLGLTVISPSVGVISLFSNKLNFLAEAEKIGIPNLVQSFDPVYTSREIERLIRNNEQSFPFVLRSVKGAGRFGQFLVQDFNGLGQKLELWCDQLRRQQGEVILFSEKHLEGARLVSVPFVRFQGGQIQIFPPTDASLQCNYGKIVEFCPAVRMSLSMRKQLFDWTIRIADLCEYVGLGILEYLVDSSRAFLFDGLPRLNTSFHLWEKVAGTRAVSWQLAAFQKEFLSGIRPFRIEKQFFSGMCLRILAEDSLYHLPQPGLVHEISDERSWKFEDIDAELALGYEKKQNLLSYDSGLLGILFVFSPVRKNLLEAAQKILKNFWIAGSFQTNERFLLELLDHPWLREGIFHSGFIDEEFLPNIRPPIELVRLVLDVCFLGLDKAIQSEENVRWLAGEQLVHWDGSQKNTLNWIAGPSLWGGSEFRGISGELKLSDETQVRVCAYPLKDHWLVRIGAWFLNVRPIFRSFRVSVQQKLGLNALVTGRVHAILYLQKTFVPAHEPLLIIESMGVFVPHALPLNVRVMGWKVHAEDQVLSGQALADIEVAER